MSRSPDATAPLRAGKRPVAGHRPRIGRAKRCAIRSRWRSRLPPSIAFVASQHGPTSPHRPMRLRPTTRARSGTSAGCSSCGISPVRSKSPQRSPHPPWSADFSAALPLVDRGVARAPKMRLPWVGGVVALFALIGALTAATVRYRCRPTISPSRSRPGRCRQAPRQSARARDRVWRAGDRRGRCLHHGRDAARTARWYKQKCASCHDDKSKYCKGPVIGPGHGDRQWLSGLMKAPSSLPYWGKTKLGQSDSGMKLVEIARRRLRCAGRSALCPQTDARDIDIVKRDRGLQVFSKACTDCPTAIDDGSAGADVPGLGALVRATTSRISSATRRRRSTWARRTPRCRGSTKS